MNNESNLKRILTFLDKPGFLRREGTVIFANDKAASINITEGADAQTIIPMSAADYDKAVRDQFPVNIDLNGRRYTGNIVRFEDCDMILLEEPEAASAALKALSLATQSLRAPLFSLMNVAESINNVTKDTAQLNRSIYQLQRTISNMADAYRYESGKPNLYVTEVVAYTDSILEKIVDALSCTDIHLSYDLMHEKAYLAMNENLYNNAIHNLIVNAAEAGAKNIHIRLDRAKDMILLSVTDDGHGIPENSRMKLFSSFMRDPDVISSQRGLGLGFVIIQNAARIHGGTVTADIPTGGKFRVTLTMRAQLDTPYLKQRPKVLVDETGGFDQTLVQLSGILPAHKYLAQK